MRPTRTGTTPRLALAVAAAAITATSLAPPASGATTSVEGTGVYDRLVLANNQDTVVIKAYGPKPASGTCDWSVNAKFRDGDGTNYTVTRACYGEDTLATSLSRGTTLKQCGGLAYSYNNTSGFYRFSVPRTCLTGLANRIKVTRSVMDLGSPSPSEAGPTAYVARG